jgi:hypothetical protein
MLTVAYPPVITNQPAGVAVVVSNNAVFSVGVAGDAPLSYQWWFNATNAVGLNTNVLTLNAVTSANAGSYSVIVTNNSGSVTSAVAVLLVMNSAPVILPVPATTNNTLGISFATQTGLNYFVEYKNALTDANWQQLTNVVGSGNIVTLYVSTTTPAIRYFRLRAQYYAVITAPLITVVVGVSNNTLGLTFLTQTGPTYYLQYESSLTANNWQVLTNVAGTGGSLTLNIPIGAPAMQYFRLMVQ